MSEEAEQELRKDFKQVTDVFQSAGIRELQDEEWFLKRF